MKRALAERVKQEMGDPIVPPSAPPSYTLDCGGGGSSVENSPTEHAPGGTRVRLPARYFGRLRGDGGEDDDGGAFVDYVGRY